MKQFIKSFFYSKDKPEPIYCWITILMTLIVIAFTQIILGYDFIKETTLLALMGMVGGLLGIYNINKNLNKDEPKDKGTIK
jgi:hypothetical protein